METALFLAIIAIAVGGGIWVWLARPPESEGGPALPPVRGVAFAQHVVEALQARGVGVTAADVDGVELSNGRRLPLAALKSRFGRAESQEERRALVDEQIEDWSVMGHILTIDDLRRRVIEVFEAEGLEPAIDPDDPFAIDMATGSFSLRRLLAEAQSGPLDALDERIAQLDELRAIGWSMGKVEPEMPL